MTCIVGIAENGKTLLGADSAAASLSAGEIYSLRNAKVFRSGAYALGFTTSYRLGQILRYETELPEPPDANLERFMATAFVEALRRAFAAQGYQRELGPKGSILIGVRGQLFTLGAELQVMSEDKPYAAVGSGRHTAYGALFALEDRDLKPRRRAAIALGAAQQFHPDVREPFVYVEA